MAAFVPLFVLASCSHETRPALHPVKGTVTVQKKPAAKAVVVFRPVTPGPLKDGLLPHGEVGPDGTFQVGTYEATDGAPAGEYVVTISWPETKTDSTGDVVSNDRLKGRYGDPAKSKWKVRIKEGHNELEPFRLD